MLKAKAKKKPGRQAKPKLAFTPAQITLAGRVLRKSLREANVFETEFDSVMKGFKKSLKTLELK